VPRRLTAVGEPHSGPRAVAATGRDTTVAPGLGEHTGPHPAARAAAGLLLGLGVGLASAVFISRRPASQHPPGSQRGPTRTSP
jgi:hypothetical protein